MRVAAFQMLIEQDLKLNLDTVSRVLETLKAENIDMLVLPEMFVCPYDIELFANFAQKEEGEVWKALSNLAKTYGIFLVGGSVPESADGHLYNTSYVFDPMGKEVAKHRKIHLFDVSVTGGQHFKESEVLSAGVEPTVFQTPFGKVGLAICYDFRFPELARLMVDAGAEILVIPAAFNMTTGPSHWEILFRTRALDNQVYTIGVAPARREQASYVSWGHSIVVSPWGETVEQLGAEEGVLVADLDLSQVQSVRKSLPLLKHRRLDVYRCEPVKCSEGDRRRRRL
ncbi:carbon-nitrogen hydrolase family protein [Fusibacter sp. JL298sf-3]